MKKVRIKRPEIKLEWVEAALTNYEWKEIQSDGRIRFYIYLPEANKYLRVVTLDDGQTIHNAMFDRAYKRKRKLS